MASVKPYRNPGHKPDVLEYPTTKPSRWRCGECGFIFHERDESKMRKHEHLTRHVWYTRLSGGAPWLV